MQFELVNRVYGIKMISPSEEHKNRFLASCKKDPKDNLPVWEVKRELPSREESKADRVAALQAELAELEGDKTVLPVGAVFTNDELEDLKRSYLLKTGKEAHRNATVKSLTEKLKEYE